MTLKKNIHLLRINEWFERRCVRFISGPKQNQTSFRYWRFLAYSKIERFTRKLCRG